MRAIRWLVLVPASLALLFLFFAMNVATHYLVVAVWIAPTHKSPVLWAALAALMLAASWLGAAGHPMSLFVAALVGGGLAVVLISRWLRRCEPSAPSTQ